MRSSSSLFIGLMSGTSLDGVDGVVADFSTAPRVLGHASRRFAPALRQELLALNRSGADELHRAALAAHALVAVYAEVVSELLLQAQRLGLGPSDITAIWAHGQTVRHQPPSRGVPGYTLQLNNPALLAELCGIDVVADFRNADLAAGGQGAPLVPGFHAALWGRSDADIAVLNIGGISNLTVLPAGGPVRGWDCGPGNALLDHWCQLHTGHSYDAGGAWAASGSIDAALLGRLLDEPFFKLDPPRSTGRDLFNARWLQDRMGKEGRRLAPEDIQATLTGLSAEVCARELLKHLPGATELLVCGGGALNLELMRLLQSALPGLTVLPSDHRGLPALQVEAAAFAWLARCWFERQAGSRAEVTGARGPRVLGALYPSSRP
ncbi:MAG: anhydro-N-acetylmuramic acid kinase [Betaproteobacteria bacterium]